MLRILALSGHEIASFAGDDLHQISGRELKQKLRGITGHSRFQQQLILDGSELKDNQTIEDVTLPMEITLVLRPLQHPPGNVELLDGVRRNDLCKIDEILKKPVDPDFSEGKKPLNLACELGLVDVTRVLLEAGAGANPPKPLYRESMRIACELGHLEVVQCLIDARASIDDPEPLRIACEYGNDKVALLLIQAGASLGRKMGEQEPLHWASLNSLEHVVELLSAADACLDNENFSGVAPLHCACEAGHLRVVKLLLDSGAAKDQAQKDGRTPSHLAAGSGHVDVVRLLLKAGAAVDKEDIAGRTALHLACANDQAGVASILREAGATHKKDAFGEEPFQLFPGKTPRKRRRAHRFGRVWYYSTEFFTQAGLPNPLAGSLLSSVIFMFATLASVPLIEKVGRRPLLLRGQIGAATSLALLTAALLANMAGFGAWTIQITLAAVIGFVVSFAISLGPIPWQIARPDNFEEADAQSLQENLPHCSLWAFQSKVPKDKHFVQKHQAKFPRTRLGTRSSPFDAEQRRSVLLLRFVRSSAPVLLWDFRSYNSHWGPHWHSHQALLCLWLALLMSAGSCQRRRTEKSCVLAYLVLIFLSPCGHIETHGCVGPSPAQEKSSAILVELNSSAMRARTGSGDREHHGSHGIKAAGKRTEEALKEVGESVNEVFKDMKEQFSKFTRPSWFGGSSKETPAQLAKPVAGGQEAHAHAHAPHPEDDTTMRHHCAALERLVEMGLSPQAAKVAVRRLDSWLVSEDGRAEMAAAEAEAFSSGEPILHVHDQVRLEGLVKNKGTNGALGILQAYGAESHRWKVTLHDGQVFWIKPKLLRPLQLRRMPLPDPSPPEDTTHTEEAQPARL
eukprot:s2023_g3.t1